MKKRILSSILILVMVMMAFTSVAMAATEKGTGLYKDDGQWKYFQDGKFTKATGLVQRPDNKTWHYVENGVYKKVTGLVQCVQPGSSKGKWYYVYKGDLNKSATGLVKCVQPGKSNGKWYYVVGGKLSKETGVVKCIQPGDSGKGKFYLVKNGKMLKTSGIAQCIQPGDSGTGKVYYVENGKLAKKTGLYSTTSYGIREAEIKAYINNGKWMFNYYGMKKIDGKNQLIIGGKLAEKYHNGFIIERDGSTNDYSNVPVTLTMVENGKISNYTGKVSAYISYYFSNGTGGAGGGRVLVELNVKNGKTTITKGDYERFSAQSDKVDYDNVIGYDSVGAPFYSFDGKVDRWNGAQTLTAGVDFGVIQ